MDRSDLANRMKDYEKRNRYYLQKRMPVILRLDSRAGHTFTRGFGRPFDEIFIQSMQETTKYLCENIQGCVLGYTQSDEITLALVDYKTLNSDAWFDYRTDKMTSIAAGMATLQFNRVFKEKALEFINNHPNNKLCEVYLKAINLGLVFDCRPFNIPKEDVTNNFYWRQLDCSRNSVQMVGQANFSHNELQNKTCNMIQDMLMTQKGINWNDLPTYQKRGTCVVKEEYTDYSVLPDMGITKSRWIIDKDIPIFKGEGREYIEKLINVGV